MCFFFSTNSCFRPSLPPCATFEVSTTLLTLLPPTFVPPPAHAHAPPAPARSPGSAAVRHQGGDGQDGREVDRPAEARVVAEPSHQRLARGQLPPGDEGAVAGGAEGGHPRGDPEGQRLPLLDDDPPGAAGDHGAHQGQHGGAGDARGHEVVRAGLRAGQHPVRGPLPRVVVHRVWGEPRDRHLQLAPGQVLPHPVVVADLVKQ